MTRALAFALSAALLPIAAIAQTLPSGWRASDIGSPKLAGYAAAQGEWFTVAGAGAGVSGRADQFMFVHRQMSGDGTLVARLDGFPTQKSRIGVMIRESLAPGSRHVFLNLSGSGNVVFMGRSVINGRTTVYRAVEGFGPLWLKLERRATRLAASWSTNGANWMSLPDVSMTLPTTLYVGLAVMSGRTDKRITATFSNVNVAASPSMNNQPPAVSMTTPTSGATFAAPAAIALAAQASDPDGAVARVDFYAGTTLLGSDSSSPYAFTWTNVPVGSYSVKAVARDTAGASSTSPASNVTVTTNQAPTVSLGAPIDGATFTAPATVALMATAADVDGSIARVEFYSGTTLIATDTASPYTFSWSNLPAGPYSVKAVARDNAGGTTASSTRSFTVSDPDLPASALWRPSSNHDTAVDRYVVEIFPNGTDPAVTSPVASQDVGKPPVVNGECRADVRSTVEALSPGTYVATVTAIGDEGESRSLPSTPFTR